MTLRRVVAAFVTAALLSVGLGFTAPMAHADDDDVKRGRSRHYAPERRRVHAPRVVERDPAEEAAIEVLVQVPIVLIAAGVEQLAQSMRGFRPGKRKKPRAPRTAPPPPVPMAGPYVVPSATGRGAMIVEGTTPTAPLAPAPAQAPAAAALGPVVAGPPMPPDLEDEGAVEASTLEAPATVAASPLPLPPPPPPPPTPLCWRRVVIHEPAIVELRGEGPTAQTVVVRPATIREIYEPVGPDGTPLR